MCITIFLLQILHRLCDRYCFYAPSKSIIFMDLPMAAAYSTYTLTIHRPTAGFITVVRNPARIVTCFITFGAISNIFSRFKWKFNNFLFLNSISEILILLYISLKALKDLTLIFNKLHFINASFYFNV